MNAYYALDRIEEQSWIVAQHQIECTERINELADDLEKALKQRFLEDMCLSELQRLGASKQAISRAFDDDVDFQERAAAFLRLMSEVIAQHQIDIEGEQ
ncbi:host-nuclease inhibitor Gam family protein [Yokenella regensburgei]|uniref:host-nuclease inhibitor Gam family protein n=1 Tax=Yokenella regensburgei TaxID=158877 RepID=UPI003F1539BB